MFTFKFFFTIGVGIALGVMVRDRTRREEMPIEMPYCDDTAALDMVQRGHCSMYINLTQDRRLILHANAFDCIVASMHMDRDRTEVIPVLETDTEKK